MDIGCGDGSLLKKIFIRIQKILSEKEHKNIKMIGVDLNNISIQKAKKNLRGIPAILIKSSIDNPDFIFKKLKHYKIDKEQVLHVRSFIDHERKINFSKKIYHRNDIISCKDDDIDGIDSNGKNMETKIINKSLDEFYSRWSKYIGKFGLINLEVFKQSLKQIKKNLDLNEGAHFDFIQTLSGQNLCKARMQLYCMAKNNLYPKNIKSYPESTNFKRIFLAHFVKKNFSSLILRENYKKDKFYFIQNKKKLVDQNKIKKDLILNNYIKHINFFHYHS